MSSFESPLGKQTFQSNQVKEFDVPEVRNPYANRQSVEDFQNKLNGINEEEADVEFERVKQSKSQRKAAANFVSDSGQKRISLLLGLTKSTRECEILGNKYVLRTLSSKEMKDAILSLTQFETNVEMMWESRRQYLGRALVEIAGIPIEDFLGSSNLEARFQFIDEMHESFLNRLYEEYSLLVKESDAKFKINSVADVTEVLSDIKK